MWMVAFLAAGPVFGQREVVAQLDLRADSLWVGRPLQARLEIRHAAEVVVVFPRRPADFAPFEVVAMRPEPTQTEGGLSRDVVEWDIRTFDLTDRQALSLSYAYLNGRDTVWQRITSDSLPLARLAPQEGSAHTAYRHGKDLLSWKVPPDYSGLLLLAALGLFVLGGLVFLLRRPLRRYVMLNRLRREWLGLRRAFAQLEHLPDQEAIFSQLNAHWRAYLDPDDTLGLGSMTTTELRTAIPSLMFLSRSQQDVLLEAARATDQVLYASARLDDNRVHDLIRRVWGIMETAYQERRHDLDVRPPGEM